MNIPADVRRNPNFIELAKYFSPEEAARLVMGNVAINRPGVVPSVQVPPGARRCEGLGEASLPMPTISQDLMRYSVQQTVGGANPQWFVPSTTSPGAVYPTGAQPTKRGGFAGWAEDNMTVLLGGIGIITAVVLLGGKRR